MHQEKSEGAKLFGKDLASHAHNDVVKSLRRSCRILNMCNTEILRKCPTEKTEGTYQRFMGTDHPHFSTAALRQLFKMGKNK